MSNPTNAERPCSVLVVDDDGDLMRSTVEMLILHGFAARGVAGAWAISVAATDQPDAVLLDPVMRGVDGSYVTRVLREKVAGRRPFMIGLTADTENEALLRTNPAFDLYLKKLAIPAVLVGVLNRFRQLLHDPWTSRGDAGQS